MGALIRVAAQLDMPWGVREKRPPRAPDDPTQRERILAELARHAIGATCLEICSAIELPVNVVAPVLTRLRKKDMIRRAGRRPNHDTQQAWVYVLVDPIP